MIVDEDDLDYDEDVSLYEGKPFTGTLRAYHSDGSIRKEAPYLDGFAEGLCKEWHFNGLLRREWSVSRGAIDGKECVWHANGNARSIAHFSKGIELDYEEWDEGGAIVTRRTIDKNSVLYKHAKKRAD
jgi:antitoxin component YwqK of YwqJK toxin-antitoxin module